MIHRFAPTIALSMGILPISLFASAFNSVPPAHSKASVAAGTVAEAPSCAGRSLAREVRSARSLMRDKPLPTGRTGQCRAEAGHALALLSQAPVQPG